jgi:RND superfamily putative drug exporter
VAAPGGVITSAGTILASTFLVLAVLPLRDVVELGVGVALGVLLDTLVERRSRRFLSPCEIQT